MDVAELAGQVVRFVVPLVGAYGGQVLTRIKQESVERVGDAAMVLGSRLLRKIMGREQSQRAVEEAVTDLAAAPDDQDAIAALRQQVKKALLADARLAVEIRQMLTGSPGFSTGDVSQHVVGFDHAQQAVQGHGNQTVIFGTQPEQYPGGSARDR